MKSKIIISLTIAALLSGCVTQQPAAPTDIAAGKLESLADVNAMMADYAKCQRLGYLAATDGDRDEIGALKFDIKTRVRNKTINVDRAACEEAMNRGKSEGFAARDAAERALAESAKKAW